MPHYSVGSPCKTEFGNGISRSAISFATALLIWTRALGHRHPDRGLICGCSAQCFASRFLMLRFFAVVRHWTVSPNRKSRGRLILPAAALRSKGRSRGNRLSSCYGPRLPTVRGARRRELGSATVARSVRIALAAANASSSSTSWSRASGQKATWRMRPAQRDDPQPLPSDARTSAAEGVFETKRSGYA